MKDDAISRQAAMNILAYGLDKIPMVNNTADETIRRDERIICIQEIRSLPSAPLWIPVSEWLPGAMDSVLVTDHGYWVDIAFYDGTKWWYRDADTEEASVSAWMPLPEPWKGEDDD